MTLKEAIFGQKPEDYKDSYSFNCHQALMEYDDYAEQFPKENLPKKTAEFAAKYGVKVDDMLSCWHTLYIHKSYLRSINEQTSTHPK